MTKKVLITGADGFIAKNLALALRERPEFELLFFRRGDDAAQLGTFVAQCDAVVHLAGVNRTNEESDFTTGNTDLSTRVAAAVSASQRPIVVIYSSSTQAELDNVYGASKRAAELELQTAADRAGFDLYVFRLPNVFGKWARPNYNSAVATFCHNIARDLPITINDPAAPLSLVYIDDVVRTFVAVLDGMAPARDNEGFCVVAPIHRTTVGVVADHIRSFRELRETRLVGRVGSGLVHGLYATYVSSLPPQAFHYPLIAHDDNRGRFVEMLRTPDSGQFSFFTARPGVTRGGHYHHSKTEKFLIIAGRARFAFRHMASNEYYELDVGDEVPEVVDTVPGWTHDITNIGTSDLIVMLWANELFDPEQPDTYACPVVKPEALV
jgi:UDP-2-acetamido-2,6-beta-L-arabino-hexul-4-ose reductase